VVAKAEHTGRGNKGRIDPSLLLAESLDARWRKYRKELKRCRKKCAEKTVHDLRVASRRLVSTLDMLRLVLPDKRLKVMRQALKKQLNLFGPLRDVQVQILDVQKMLVSYPQLELFLTILLLRERQLMKRIVKNVRKVETRSLGQYVGILKSLVRTRFSDPQLARVCMAALKGAAAAALARSVDLLRKVDPEDTQTIHRLRLSFKKLRYTLEVLGPLLGGMPEKRLKAMNEYQVKMGNVQDIEVLMANINSFASRRLRSRTSSLQPVHQELAKRRLVLIETFMQSANDLYTFWGDRINSSRERPSDARVRDGKANAHAD